MLKNKIRFSVIILFAIFILNSCEIYRCMVFNLADVNDYKIFPKREIEIPDSQFHFTAGALQLDSRISITNLKLKKQTILFDEFLKENQTLAFLVIHNDTLLFEKYYNNCQQSTIIPSFSVAKSVTSLLIGCAIDDGYIKSIDQPITDYIPELNVEFKNVTIKHLLQMTSGVNFKENYYSLINSTPQYYYGINLRKKISQLRVKGEPGKIFEYKSVNTELLGLILERSLKKENVTQYLQKKIWQPLGMEYNASWSIDRYLNGIEKTFCCLNARARDFAKIGRLYLKKGNWNGKQIVSEKWINESTKINNFSEAQHYQYQWWIASKDGDFYAHGWLGQYIYVNPNKKLIIVRLGKKGANINWPNRFICIAKKFK
jgi:CubicO group peptidase (beta-lactamase class C family)